MFSRRRERAIMVTRLVLLPLVTSKVALCIWLIIIFRAAEKIER